MRRPSRIPGATYRLQFSPEFTLNDARNLLDYLQELGITDLYASPLLEPVPGSRHGYDIVRHDRINPELGGDASFLHLTEDLRRRGMGLLLDVVPNHMGIGGGANPWWEDVLENGPGSRYAHYFDIDWESDLPDMRGRVLLPILDDQFGRVLESGRIRVVWDDGAFRLRCDERILPLALRSWAIPLSILLRRARRVLSPEDAVFRDISSLHERIRRTARPWETDRELVGARGELKEECVARLREIFQGNPTLSSVLESALAELNGVPGRPRSFNRLERLLSDQAYRLSFWHVAAEEINYRRFFDVNDLAAIRVEDPEVFHATHAKILEWIARGLVTGLRIDHIDGLNDPKGYLERIQGERERLLAGSGSSKRAEDALFVVVEKILSPRERLCDSWPVHGTTGYDFLYHADGIQVVRDAQGAFRDLYYRLTGGSSNFPRISRESRTLILDVTLSSELQVLANLLLRIAKRGRASRDFTPRGLREALTEIIVSFPVYRSYIDARCRVVREEDRAAIRTAVRTARMLNPAVDPSIYAFIERLLLLEGEEAEEGFREEVRRFVMRFQQLTAPVMAKGVEDTAFYRAFPLASLNEVGGEPRSFGVGLDEFHEFLAKRARETPFTLNAASTHDTKRSEDVRARINALSEIPSEWHRACAAWMERNRRWKVLVEGEEYPSRNDEYLYYQTLIGTLPFSETEINDAFRGRIKEYLRKAVREAKIRSSWIHPNVEYEAALERFVDKTLSDDGEEGFRTSIVRFARPLQESGIWNSLSGLLLKIAAPGIPDFYRGTELWDFSLVDPDNRRPVDFKLRKALLRDLPTLPLRKESLSELLASRFDGRIKLFLMRSGLRFRREHPLPFQEGGYRPADSSGEKETHIVGFIRSAVRETVLCAVLRHPLRAGAAETLPIGERFWGDTRLTFSEDLPAGGWTDVLSGWKKDVPPGVASLEAARLFSDLPVALWYHEG
ncbi:MAG: malto-oligosyltrehalose synthase [Candidatus Hydrogenedentota bacterium]|nr:MAG: malto-oligosyltrehalose synthase [Candidatus Hydrogenedentota bacterium]